MTAETIAALNFGKRGLASAASAGLIDQYLEALPKV
jgi:hypothetical protein